MVGSDTVRLSILASVAQSARACRSGGRSGRLRFLADCLRVATNLVDSAGQPRLASSCLATRWPDGPLVTLRDLLERRKGLARSLRLQHLSHTSGGAMANFS